MLTEVPFGRVVEHGLEKPRHQQGTLIGDRGEEFPSTLFKYYSLEGLEKTISTNTFKWELSCNENDPFEALATGWDKESIRKVLPTANAELGARSDAIFNSLDIQKSISYAAAYLSFSECANNILMWSHYAENGMGACVEIDVRHLLENISMDLVRVVYAEEVADARRRVPPLNDDNNEDSQKLIRNFLSYKAKEWEYEHEWRLIDPPMANCMTPGS